MITKEYWHYNNEMQVCIEESGSDEEGARDGTRGNDRDRLPSNQILERGRSYKSHQVKRPSGGYQEHGMRSDHHGHRNRMASGSAAYREHGMTKPPALFSYHNVQKKSCLVEEESEESETEEEEAELYEKEQEELIDSEESEENEGDEEEKVVEEVRWWGGSGGSGLRKMSPSSSVKSLQAEARRRFSGVTLFAGYVFFKFTLFLCETGFTLLFQWETLASSSPPSLMLNPQPPSIFSLRTDSTIFWKRRRPRMKKKKKGESAKKRKKRESLSLLRRRMRRRRSVKDFL